MMVHHLPFFSSILPSMGVFVGTSKPGDSIALFGLLRNSPVAVVCSSECFGVLENQPPGKNRDEVVIEHGVDITLNVRHILLPILSSH